MTPACLKELAEVLEDKGSFLRGPPSAPNQPRITFQSADYQETRRVADLLGVRYIRRVTLYRMKPPGLSFHTQLKASRAVQLMRELRPLLSEARREDLDYALEGVLFITRRSVNGHKLLIRDGFHPKVGGRAYRTMAR